MSNIKEILNISSVFNSIGDDDTLQLEPLFEKREIYPGEILATEKEVAQFFFLLEKGTVLLAMEEGKSVVLNTPGDFIGLELLSAKGIYKTTVTVLEKGSVFVIPREEFLAVIREDSVAAAAIMASWQEYLDQTASFSKIIEDIRLPYNF